MSTEPQRIRQPRVCDTANRTPRGFKRCDRYDDYNCIVVDCRKKGKWTPRKPNNKRICYCNTHVETKRATDYDTCCCVDSFNCDGETPTHAIHIMYCNKSDPKFEVELRYVCHACLMYTMLDVNDASRKNINMVIHRIDNPIPDCGCVVHEIADESEDDEVDEDIQDDDKDFCEESRWVTD